MQKSQNFEGDSRLENVPSTSERFEAGKKKILSIWAERAREKEPAAQELSHLELLDSLPKFLDELAQALSIHSVKHFSGHKEEQLAREHGEERSDSGSYDLYQVIDEYHLLTHVIFEVLRDSGPVSDEDSDLIHDAIQLGVRNAACEFVRRRSERESEISRNARETEARYKAIFEGIRDHAIIRTDLDGAIIEWNPGAEHIFQYSKEEVEGKSASIIFTPEDLSQNVDETEMKTAQEKGCAEDKRWHIKKDGSRFYAAGIMNPFYSASGELAGYIKVLRDNTSEKILHERLADKRAKLKEANLLVENARRELHDLIMQAPVPLVAFSGPEHRFTIANPPYEKLVGRRVVGKTVSEVFTHEEANLFKPLLDRVYQTGTPYIGRELPFNARDESGRVNQYFIDIGYYPVRDGTGTITGLLAVVYDVTEKVEARLALEASERQLKLIIDTQSNLISYIDRDYRYVFVNKAYDNWFHLPAESLVGKIVGEVAGEETFRQLKPLLEKAFRGERVSFEKQVDYSDGPRFIRAAFIPDRDPSGEVKGIFATIVDITAEKETEQRIRESESRFRKLANALPQIAWTATPDGFVDWYNDWFYEYTQLPRGIRWDDAEAMPMHPEDVERTKAIWYNTVAAGLPFEMEQRFKRGSDGAYRWHIVRGIPILDSDGKVVKYVGANTDIHDQKVMTDALIEERALRERFTNALTHDLRNPIAAARLSAQILLKYRENESQRDKHANRILDSLERAERMIGDLLDANRIKAGESIPMTMDQCDLVVIAQNSLDEMEMAHGERFQLKGDKECRGIWSCETIRRVFDNLIGNAVKYGTADTPITVTIQRSEAEARFSVHNFGNELSPEEARGLFTMFRRTKRAEASQLQGWGIGLVLVKGIVEAHRGKVWVASTPGDGTTFTVTLPLDSRAP